MGNSGGVPRSDVIGENMKKQQEFITENQKLLLERQMIMQQLLHERKAAMELARSRETFNWVVAYVTPPSIVLLTNAVKFRNPRLLLLLLPLCLGFGYQLDMAYGTKLSRIRSDAEKLINEKKSSLRLPNGAVTYEEVEFYRSK